jgi:hypothetical protein
MAMGVALWENRGKDSGERFAPRSPGIDNEHDFVPLPSDLQLTDCKATNLRLNRIAASRGNDRAGGNIWRSDQDRA